MATERTFASPESTQKPADPTRDAETQKLLQRLRTPKKSRPPVRVLLGDAALGIALGIMVTVVFSLMFKPLQWVTAGLTGH